MGAMLTIAFASATLANAGDPAFFLDIGPYTQQDNSQADPFDLSADGTYVVGDNRSPGIQMGFRWSEALGYEELGGLPGGGNSGAWAVSADGTTVVGTGASSLNPNTQAFRWTLGGGMESLGDLGFGNSDAFDITDDGTLIVGRLTSTTSFYWSADSGMVAVPGLSVAAVAGGGTAPPPLPAGDFATLAGQIFGGPNSGEVALWTPSGGVQQLGFVGAPTRVTPDGSVIIGLQAGAGAFRWTQSGGLEDLGSLPGGGGGSEAMGVTADGSIVVGWSMPGPQPFIWDAANGMRDLQVVLTEDFGLDLTGWNLRQALGISADGSTIVGTGTGPPSNQDRIWVAHLGDPLLPIQQEDAKLTADDGGPGHFFGRSVSISGDTVVVGASGDDHAGFQSGSAYVYVRSGITWTQQAKLTASDAGPNDSFGDSVAIWGDTIVVGALADEPAGVLSGSAYVFVREGTTWAEQAKLTASDGASVDEFGNSVGISGDTIVIGARFDDAPAYNSGSAYVFKRSGGAWSEVQKLTASDAEEQDHFGFSVAISCDTIVVGSWRDDDACPTDPDCDSGSAYAFVHDGATWTEQAKLAAADAAAGNWLGFTAAISGDTAVLGAKSADGQGIFSGSAYVFVRDGTSWAQQAKLSTDDPFPDEGFIAVAISGDRVVVGDDLDNDGGDDAGAAWTFVRSGTTWSPQAKLTASDATADDKFGGSVAIAGGTAVIGARGDDDGGPASGSAYVLDLDAFDPWTDLGNGLAGTHGIPLLTGVGTLVACEPLTLTLGNALENAPAFLFVGVSALNFSPFFGGTLVPDFTIPPGQILVLFTDGGGEAPLGASWPPGVPSAFELYLQYWVSDLGGPFGFSASNAILATTP